MIAIVQILFLWLFLQFLALRKRPKVNGEFRGWVLERYNGKSRLLYLRSLHMLTLTSDVDSLDGRKSNNHRCGRHSHCAHMGQDVWYQQGINEDWVPYAVGDASTS